MYRWKTNGLDHFPILCIFIMRFTSVCISCCIQNPKQSKRNWIESNFWTLLLSVSSVNLRINDQRNPRSESSRRVFSSSSFSSWVQSSLQPLLSSLVRKFAECTWHGTSIHPTSVSRMIYALRGPEAAFSSPGASLPPSLSPSPLHGAK